MNSRSLKPSLLWRVTVIVCISMWIWVLAISTVYYNKHDSDRPVVIHVLAQENNNYENDVVGDAVNLELPEPVPVPAPPVEVELEGNYQVALEVMEESARTHITAEGYKNPKTVVVAATWRTGSTFFAEALNTHPWIYYHYEPLTGIKIAPDHEQMREIIDALSTCAYHKIRSYMQIISENKDLLMRNNKIRKACEYLGNDCFNPEFLSRACNFFPVQLLKTVRMQINAFESFLTSPEFYVIFLVRDPRAIFASRLKLKWCTDDEICANPDVLCNSLKTDLMDYKALKIRYPTKVHLVRYEDLAKDPLETMKKIFQELHVPWDEEIRTYLEEHTNANLDQPWTTHRISRLRINSWRKTLSADMVGYIQDNCDDFLNELNYTAIDVSLCTEFC